MVIVDHHQFPRRLTSSNFEPSANECLMSPLLAFPYCPTHLWSGWRWSWSWSSWWSWSSQWSWWSFSYYILQSVLAQLALNQDLYDPSKWYEFCSILCWLYSLVAWLDIICLLSSPLKDVCWCAEQTNLLTKHVDATPHPDDAAICSSSNSIPQNCHRHFFWQKFVNHKLRYFFVW